MKIISEVDPREKYKNAIDGTQVIYDDMYLEPHAQCIRDRFSNFQWWKKEISDKEGGSLDSFAQAYKHYGFHRVEKGITYKVWAPGAESLSIFGDFNNWNRYSHPCKRDVYGVWTILIPNKEDGSPPIEHKSQVKLAITANGSVGTRIDPWAKYVVPPDTGITYNGIYWDPPEPYVWKHKSPPKPDRLRIYETHIGMSSEKEEIASYTHFKDNVLPYIAETGYNCVQIMAVMEHTYYASFGYQVTNFFAASSRFGTPEELKALIDKAHELNLFVLLDLVHSHASKNVDDGINMFDWSDSCFFHSGPTGTHQMWDSRLFDYSKWEVLRFLLSNLRWWLDEYKFDGFRFDGVTSMLLKSRAVGVDLPRDYNGYFGDLIDTDALCYLTLANDYIHDFFPNTITIAEDAMGYATLGRPTKEGGVGFDYRMGMGIADKWKKLTEVKDEDWNMGGITFELANRRWKESTVAYVECHDQAIVGDKTLAFILMDKEMYSNMSDFTEMTIVIDRGISLHKIIRLITFGLGGEGYLTFMGNEFGHPEWLDFPREGNGESYKYCRRQWNLVKDPCLRYKYLYEFEKSMLHLEEQYAWMRKNQYISIAHESDKIIVYERGELLFVFNFHHSNSYPDYKVPVEIAGKYKIVLDSDQKKFGGHERITSDVEYFTKPEPYYNRKNTLSIYIPSRTGLVFAPVGTGNIQKEKITTNQSDTSKSNNKSSIKDLFCAGTSG